MIFIVNKYERSHRNILRPHSLMTSMASDREKSGQNISDDRCGVSRFFRGSKALKRKREDQLRADPLFWR